MPLITLTTDFGISDTYAGVMKGVILSIAPQAQIVDITHGVPPQDILAGALILEEAYGWFPAGTIHLVVVDPGVGSTRVPVAVRAGRYFFVGPDNGVMALAMQRERAQSKSEFHAVRLANPAYQMQPVSSTFHGRDIFAPAAAYLANGIPLHKFGPNLPELKRCCCPEPVLQELLLEAQIVRVDRFGNLITNLTRDFLHEWNRWARPIVAQIGPREIPFKNTFSDVSSGDAVAYLGSGGRVEIGVNGGSASRYFQIAAGGTVLFRMN